MESTATDAEELNAPENKEFVAYLSREIDDFLKTNGNSNTIMLFPPFNSYKRLLIHHLVEINYDNCGLSTFSIGEEPRRRTVVCLGSLRKNILTDDANDSKGSKSRPKARAYPNDGVYKTPIRVKSLQCDGDLNKDQTKGSVDRHRKVRKTISYYVPPHLRKAGLDSEPAVKKEKKDVAIDEEKLVESTTVTSNDIADVLPRNSTPVTGGSQDPKTLAPIKAALLEVENSKFNGVETGRETPSNELAVINTNDPAWDPLFCGKGTCSFPNVVIPILDDSEINDITNEVGRVRVVEVVGPSSEELSESNDYANSSMIEIYDLPEDMNTEDLARTFEEYVPRGFRLRWVDKSHALGIFSSSKSAEEALSGAFARIKIRPIAQGTLLSQEIARNVVLPSSFRPKTCSSLAKRLLSGALGLKVSPLSAEERAAQKERLKECKDLRRKIPHETISN